MKQATGGTITYTDSAGLNPVVDTPYLDGYVVHTFTTNGTFTPIESGVIDYLIVAGGGGGGIDSYGGRGSGGGGAGGLLSGSAHSVSTTGYAVVVGNGGLGGTGGGSAGAAGAASSFDSISAIGGGAGAGITTSGSLGGNCSIGGSGGGGWHAGSGAAGTSGQGNDGGTGNGGSPYNGGGGGGAGGAGTAGGSGSGQGGAGIASSITGVSVTYASGGGGRGSYGCNIPAANTGGGGGGCGTAGKDGASGIVVIKYAYTKPFISYNIPKLAFSESVFVPMVNPWVENVLTTTPAFNIFVPFGQAAIQSYIPTSLCVHTLLLPVSYLLAQEIPLSSNIATIHTPSFNATYEPPLLTVTSTIFSVIGTPEQIYVDTVLGTVILFEPYTNPFQQNVPTFQTLTSVSFNPTCYRPPVFAGINKAILAMMPTNKRFIRSGV